VVASVRWLRAAGAEGEDDADGWLYWIQFEDGDHEELSESDVEQILVRQSSKSVREREEERKERRRAELAAYKARSISHWSPYDPVRVVNVIP
jgi:hypothetical protein